MNTISVRTILSFFFILFIIPTEIYSQPKLEFLRRGVIAQNSSDNKVFVSWRWLASDPENASFNIYRKTGNEDRQKRNSNPISDVTFFVDTLIDFSRPVTYFVLETSEEKNKSIVANGFTIYPENKEKRYISVPLQIPPSYEVNGRTCSYSANDASVGDLDGDGEYEIVLKWQPSFTRNPPQTGLTGKQIIDAYEMDGTQLWRIDLGKNIRAGAAYTQFMVYDLDSDGKAEMICKTADGSIDGTGKIIGDSTKDWRTFDRESRMYGKIVNGPEYLTVFNGKTGKALVTENYIPDRFPLDGWGGIGGNGNNDNTGSRADRFTAGIAYLDGIHPSAVFVRGWYGRTAVAAWDYHNGKLTSRWVFDSENEDNPYSGQANHSLSVADVDGDGKDEICVGSMTVDDNGEGLYTTGLRHGDALHLTDMDTTRAGLEVFGIHENEGRTVRLQTPGSALFDAATGEVIWGVGPGIDVGRGVAADIDPTIPGFENWGGPGGLRDIKGNTISEKTPSSTNFVIWWDGDLTRELLDKNRIDKWDWENETTENLLTADECSSNNGTKATPCLSADLFGDWREEVIWRTENNSELRIYTTTIPTEYRFYTLMHDPQYRLAIAWQNGAYNQPPHPGFYLGNGAKPVRPDVELIKLKE